MLFRLARLVLKYTCEWFTHTHSLAVHYYEGAYAESSVATLGVMLFQKLDVFVITFTEGKVCASVFHWAH
jgi:hypothetical protein